jgi:hypothetical protein
VATPANWKDDDVGWPFSIQDRPSWRRFPKGFTAVRPYLRMTLANK